MLLNVDFLFLFFFPSVRSLCWMSATHDEEASAIAAAANVDSGAPTMYLPF